MNIQTFPVTCDPVTHVMYFAPDHAVIYFCPDVLQETAQSFLSGFDGVTTYAVKANPHEEVLGALVAAGVQAFDVASPAEMYAARRASPSAILHYNNPVRSPDEILEGRRMGVTSWSVDSLSELEKLADVDRDCEISVRLALPVPGAVYDFGAKFGVGPEQAQQLLARVAEMGFRPAITFHPGTQCIAAEAWETYIKVSAEVARAAGVRLERLNVGGGFPAHRQGAAPDLQAVFNRISAAVRAHFGADAPTLVCEPGRAMVAESFALAARVKALRPDGSIFLNDGIYGGLAEFTSLPAIDRIDVLGPDGQRRRGTAFARIVYGPTCDSIDRLPEPLPLPDDIDEGDHLLFYGMGAYSLALATRFNGYGPGDPIVVSRL